MSDDMHGVSDEQLTAGLEEIRPLLREEAESGSTPGLRESAQKALTAVEDALGRHREAGGQP